MVLKMQILSILVGANRVQLPLLLHLRRVPMTEARLVKSHPSPSSLAFSIRLLHQVKGHTRTARHTKDKRPGSLLVSVVFAI